MMRAYFRVITAILLKDLISEMRSRKFLVAMLTFALLVIVIFNFSLDLQPTVRNTITPGILWVTFIFSGTVSINRTMALEIDNGCIDGLLLNPTDRSAVYFGKFLSNLFFISIIESIVLVIYSVLYNINLARPGLLLVILLGTIGYVAVATLLSTMTTQTHMREILLPILLLPVVLPIILAAVKASSGFLQESAKNTIIPWINLLIVYDVIFLIISFLTFEYISEE